MVVITRRKKILTRPEVIERLKAGETITWLGGGDFRAYMTNHWDETVRYDTIHRLWKENLITDYGFPQLHGTIRLKKS